MSFSYNQLGQIFFLKMGDNIFFSIDIDIGLISWGVNFIYIDIHIDKSYLTCVSSYIYQFFAILPLSQLLRHALLCHAHAW